MPEFGSINLEGLRRDLSPSRLLNTLKRGFDYRYTMPDPETAADPSLLSLFDPTPEIGRMTPAQRARIGIQGDYEIDPGSPDIAAEYGGPLDAPFSMPPLLPPKFDLEPPQPATSPTSSSPAPQHSRSSAARQRTQPDHLGSLADAVPTAVKQVTFGLPKFSPRPEERTSSEPVPGYGSNLDVNADNPEAVPYEMAAVSSQLRQPSIDLAPRPPDIMPSPSGAPPVMASPQEYDALAEHGLSEHGDAYDRALARMEQNPVELEKRGPWHQILGGLASMTRPTAGLAPGLQYRNLDEYQTDRERREAAAEYLKMSGDHQGQAIGETEADTRRTMASTDRRKLEADLAGAGKISPGVIANLMTSGFEQITDPNEYDPARYSTTGQVGDQLWGKIKTNKPIVARIPVEEARKVFGAGIQFTSDTVDLDQEQFDALYLKGLQTKDRPLLTMLKPDQRGEQTVIQVMGNDENGRPIIQTAGTGISEPPRGSGTGAGQPVTDVVYGPDGQQRVVNRKDLINQQLPEGWSFEKPYDASRRSAEGLNEAATQLASAAADPDADLEGEELGQFLLQRAQMIVNQHNAVPGNPPIAINDLIQLLPMDQQMALQEALTPKPPDERGFFDRIGDAVGAFTGRTQQAGPPPVQAAPQPQPQPSGLMTRDEFVMDFQREEGRPPTAQEIEKLRGTAWQ